MRSRGSIWFLVLTVITLGWYGFFGAIVIMDAGVSASEAAHLAGAVLCVGLIAAGLLPSWSPRRGTSPASSRLWWSRWR